MVIAGLVENLLAEVRESPLPAWAVMQAIAVATAFAWFTKRTTARPGLRLCLAVAFAGAAVGAYGLGTSWRWHLGHDHGVRPAAMGFGALLGLVLTYALLARRRGHDLAGALDILGPVLGVLVGIGRLGCFLGGCDFGAVSDAPWAVRYPAGSPAFHQHVAAGLVLPSDAGSLSVHPTQLYEAAIGALMIVAALAIGSRRLRPGAAFVAAGATYAVGRSLVEVVRGDAMRGGFGPLSIAQVMSLVVLVVCAIWASRRGKTRAIGCAQSQCSGPGSRGRGFA